jgi:hypothetical protein
MVLEIILLWFAPIILRQKPKSLMLMAFTKLWKEDAARDASIRWIVGILVQRHAILGITGTLFALNNVLIP